ncbi:hypothetical protein NLM27_41505 [Bradyrhizobium sp. CCGB12]|uniref:hypothetical protein n=1 Tax=Bradyrhizobium sp. CCGB12 TaxID=2949632 RepID=UPI0020B1A185|nr:hypothetical protein [Bradyrhizobium sp. CCGB12]MCP3395218.1 hypothetical protein [Bradyrhizobium sp. CCGB12]
MIRDLRPSPAAVVHVTMRDASVPVEADSDIFEVVQGACLTHDDFAVHVLDRFQESDFALIVDVAQTDIAHL